MSRTGGTWRPFGQRKTATLPKTVLDVRMAGKRAKFHRHLPENTFDSGQLHVHCSLPGSLLCPAQSTDRNWNRTTSFPHIAPPSPPPHTHAFTYPEIAPLKLAVVYLSYQTSRSSSHGWQKSKVPEIQLIFRLYAFSLLDSKGNAEFYWHSDELKKVSLLTPFTKCLHHNLWSVDSNTNQGQTHCWNICNSKTAHHCTSVVKRQFTVW